MDPKRTILNLTDPLLTTDLLRQRIMGAKDANIYGICVLPGWARTAQIMAARSELRVRTLIGYPTGVQTASVKGLETRLAVQDGASELVITPNVGYFLGGQGDETTKEIGYVAKALREAAPDRARALAVLVDVNSLPAVQLAPFVALLLQAGGRGLHLRYTQPTTPQQAVSHLRQFTTRSTTASVALQLAPGQAAMGDDWLSSGVDYVLVDELTAG